MRQVLIVSKLSTRLSSLGWSMALAFGFALVRVFLSDSCQAQITLGSVDASFQALPGAYSPLLALHDGKMLVLVSGGGESGGFQQYTGVAKMNLDGSQDRDFD